MKAPAIGLNSVGKETSETDRNMIVKIINYNAEGEK